MNSASKSSLPATLSRQLRRWPLVLALTLLLLSLTACLSLLGGGDDGGAAAPENVPDTQVRRFGDQEVLPAGPGYLVCTQSCGDFGQCGTSDLGTVVLLNSQGPAGKVHDRAVPDKSQIQINSAIEEVVFPDSGAQSYTARFYNVTIQDQGQAWVAGWCVSTLPE